jgi:hypothetical protein
MKRKWIAALILGLVITSLVVSIGVAQTGSGYNLSWNVVGGGGSQGMTGSNYSLDSTAGQNVIAISSGSGRDLPQGFWSFLTQIRQFVPLIAKKWR